MAMPLEHACDLQAVDARLQEVLRDRSELVTRLVGHTAEAGGKRLRPLLCLLAGAFGRPERRESVIRVAAGLELIHLATLAHDDVVDGAATRRGRPTISALWGNSLAVLAGDWLFAASFELLYVDEDARLVRLIARMVRELCAGVIEEAEGAGALGTGLQPYYDRIYRKTAVFLETACRVGALAGGAPVEVQSALGAFGRRVGLAFQITDDILDFTGDPAVMGKPIGGDLRHGVATLPLILGQRDAAVRPLLERSFGRARASDAQVGRVARALVHSGAIGKANEAARDLAGQAKRAVCSLRAPGPVADLCALADLAVDRER